MCYNRGMKTESPFAHVAPVLLAVSLFAVRPAPASDYTLYNVVPMALGREAEQAARCVELYERAGVDLALYSLTLHPEGVPAREKVDRYVASFRAFAAALKGTPVKPCVLVQAILGHWPRNDKDKEPWTRTVNASGREVRFCALDPRFGDYISYVFTEIAKAGPKFILTDDDIRAFSHEAECFCPLHVKLFNERRGTSYTEAQLRAAVKDGKPGEADYDAFMKMQRELIEEHVVGRARAAIDAVDPTIPGGICIPGQEHWHAEPSARRFAAKGQTPILRTATGNYDERLGASWMPWLVCRMSGFVEYFRGHGVELLCEADTCPQNLWSKGARAFHTHMAMSAFLGMRGAKTWYVNCLRSDGAPVTRAYTDVLAENRGFLDGVARAVEGSTSDGVAVPCFTTHPGWHAVKNPYQFFFSSNEAYTRVNAGAFACAPFGVPYRMCRDFGDRNVVFLLSNASEVERLTDAELEKLFSGRVFVFREAALAMTKRGRSDLMGVEAAAKELVFTAERVKGSGAFIGFSPKLDLSAELKALPGAEAVSDLVFRPYVGSQDVSVVAPASVFYRNRLGGAVVTSVYHGKMYGLHQLSEDRKAWFVDCIDRLSGNTQTLVCGNDLDVLCASRRTADGARLVMAIDLNPDPVRRFRFRAGDVTKAEAMDAHGAWRPVAFTRDGVWTELDASGAFYEFKLFRFTVRDK